MEYHFLTQKSRADKAINILKGLTQGILSDGKVTDGEVIELKNWSDQNSFITSKQPFNEFMVAISELELETMSNKERFDIIEDVFWLCQKVESDGVYYDALTSEIQTLLGYCHGIMADYILEDQEIFSLQTWLKENSHMQGHFVYADLFSLVNDILDDGIIDTNERKMLSEFLNGLIKRADSENEVLKEASFNPILENVEIKTFSDLQFVLTGEFKFGKKSLVSQLITDRGGITKNAPTKSTSYVIVGEAGNSAWAYSRFGRKVEKAFDLKKSGINIQVVPETTLLNALK